MKHQRYTYRVSRVELIDRERWSLVDHAFQVAIGQYTKSGDPEIRQLALSNLKSIKIPEEDCFEFKQILKGLESDTRAEKLRDKLDLLNKLLTSTSSLESKKDGFQLEFCFSSDD